jgi:hypothetical protein
MLTRLGAPRVRVVVVVLAALGVALYGVTQLVASLTAPPPVTAVANVDGLTTQVTKVGWVQMTHDMSPNAPGYQMPPAMMPGMPQGDDQRLAVAVSVLNTTGDTRPLRAEEEFTLHGKAGKQWPAQTGTFGDLPRLAPRNAVDGVLYFDLPPADIDASAWLEWSHDGTTTRLSVPFDGAAPTHSHSQ